VGNYYKLIGFYRGKPWEASYWLSILWLHIPSNALSIVINLPAGRNIVAYFAAASMTDKKVF